MLLNMRRLDMIKDVPYPAQPEKPLLYAIISHHKKVGSALLKKKRFFKKKECSFSNFQAALEQ